MHHRGVLFGREAFGRVGVDFAWNVHVVKIGDSGARLAKGAILPRSNSRGGAGAVWFGNSQDANDEWSRRKNGRIGGHIVMPPGRLWKILEVGDNRNGRSKRTRKGNG
jgi:hypothetical protein